MKLKPLRNNIFVVQDEKREDVTDFGLVISASQGMIRSQEQFGRSGTVVEVGPDVDSDQLKVGDRVLFGEFANKEVVIDGKKYIGLSDQDVAGVYE